MRVSIRDVARRAGVSHVTVANVLNGRQHRTSAETYEHVLKTAREMNYIPVAQPPSQRRHIETRIIGLVYDHGDWEDYLPTYKGLRDAALKHGYDLLTILRQPPPEGLSQNEVRFLDRRTDGLIFLVPEKRNETFQKLIEHNIPVVSCYISDVPEGVAHVEIDNRDAMRQAVQHLLQLGHKNLLFVGTSVPRSDFRHRLESYTAEVAAAGLEPHQVLIDNYSEQSAGWEGRVVAEIKRRQITAVICASDWFAVFLHQAMLEAGLRIPQDVSLFGMDDEKGAADLGISSIRFSCVDVGVAAFESVLNLINGEEAAANHHTLPVQLTLRGSTAPPPVPQVEYKNKSAKPANSV